MSLRQDTAIERGASFILDVTLLDEDGEELDPSDGELHYRIADRPGRAPVLEYSSLDSGAELTAEDAGGSLGWMASINLPDETTEDLTPGTYYHELAFTDVNGAVAILLYGNLAVFDTLAANA